MSASKPHLCFVAPTIWPVFSGDRTVQVVGGAEVQQTILIRHLVRAGYRVSLVTMDHGQGDGIELDGVRVYTCHTPEGGLPVLRFLHPRLSGLWRAMARANADIYYQRSSGAGTGIVAQFCRWHGRRFVYASASDRDFLPDLPNIAYARDRWLFRRGIAQADALVVQSARQLEACQRVYGRSATLVHSCHDPGAAPRHDAQGYVLWAGSVKSLKRPELFIELARRLPALRFRMVGGGSGAAYEATCRAAAELPNVEFVGYVPYAEVHQHFDGARVFINTSVWEGFPNTFLQAWARQIPTVSFFDTGSAVAGQPVVEVVPDLDAMAAAVARLMTDDAAWRASGQRAHACFEQLHTPRAAVAAYGAVFARLAGGGEG